MCVNGMQKINKCFETLVNHPNQLELRFHRVFWERRPKFQNSKMNIVTTMWKNSHTRKENEGYKPTP